MTSLAYWTFGNMISSSRSDAFSTTCTTSRYVHLVSHAFTRTQTTVSPQSSSLIAFTTLSRAASFSSGATESSRSRNTMSAPRPGALPSIFSLEPGTARHVRRGRLRDRSDMPVRVDRVRPRAETGCKCARGMTTSLTELGDGVYAWLQPGGESGVSNAGVVVDDDGITVIDTLMVRSQWEPFAAAVEALDLPDQAHDPHPRARRPRRRHQGVPQDRRSTDRSRRATRSTSRCPSTRTRRSCLRSRRSSTTSTSSARGRSPTSSPAPRHSRRASRCSPPKGTPPATSSCSSPTPTCASPATSASSASRRSRSRATPRCGPTCSTRSSSSPT